MLKNFDVIEFTKNLSSEVFEYLPKDLDESQRKYIIDITSRFCLMAGNALKEDTQCRCEIEQAKLISQFVAEWTYHQAIVLTRAGIEKDLKDDILEDLALVIFDKTKKLLNEGIKISKVVKEINTQVDLIFNTILYSLVDKNKISLELKARILYFSLVYKKKGKNNKTSDFTKYFVLYSQRFLAIIVSIFVVIPTVLLFCSLFYKDYSWYKSHFLELSAIVFAISAALWGIYKFFDIRIEKSLSELEEIRDKMQGMVNPDKMYSRLGVDVLSLHIGLELIPIVDPETGGELLPKIAALRQNMTDELGYIIPNVRIMDNIKNNEHEYSIRIRNNIVVSGNVYPQKVMVLAKDFAINDINVPENQIEDICPINNEKVYWVKEEDLKDKKITSLMPENVILNHLREITIQYADYLIDLPYITNLVQMMKEKHDIYARALIPSLLTDVDLKNILIILIKDRVPIKDTVLIFEKLCDYARFTKDPLILAQKLKEDLKIEKVKIKY